MARLLDVPQMADVEDLPPTAELAISPAEVYSLLRAGDPPDSRCRPQRVIDQPVSPYDQILSFPRQSDLLAIINSGH